MYLKYIYLFGILILISCSSSENNLDEYPVSKKVNFEENLHGYNISDSYRWLEDFTSDESYHEKEIKNVELKRVCKICEISFDMLQYKLLKLRK